MLADEIEQQPDNVVFQAAQPLGATPPVPVFKQKLLGALTSAGERRLDALSQRAPQFISAGVLARQLFKLGRERGFVDEIVAAMGRFAGRAGFALECHGHVVSRIAEPYFDVIARRG